MVKGAMLFLLFVSLTASAQVLAPSAREVAFSFQSTVSMEMPSGYSPKDLARLQATHLFGIFSSAENIRSYGINPDLVGGMGAPKIEMNIQILSKSQKDGKMTIAYSSQGTFLFHNKVADKLLEKGTLTVALPQVPLETYDSRCTDSHYDSMEDFWYFYNPFRKGCEYLYQPPVSNRVDIKISAVPASREDASPRLDLVRGDNGNGSIFSMYVIHGYYESSKDPKDEGRKGYLAYGQFLRSLGFAEKRLRENTSWPLTIFTGQMSLTNGKTIDIEVRHALVESGAESRNLYFAKLFKEAVENGDVVIYSGHSGLGSNLDIPYLENKAGKFVFPEKKRQIFFFESCSSYSYYLDHFRSTKTRAKIDVVTNGLSSYFETSHDILTMFTAHMLNPQGSQTTWLNILRDMETPMGGGSYLINVGGL